MSSDQMKGMFDRVKNNKIRMGNFETPEQDMLCIRSMMDFPNRPFSVADLCAGSGRALETLTSGSVGVTFGIEPNEEKYIELRSRANYALYGGYEQCRMSKDYFRLMYLNPPYDDDSESSDTKSERKEKIFLRHLIQYLSVDGIFVFNIPRRRMTRDIVNLLVTNLDDIQVYQSHDETFNQVFTIGRKRANKFINRTEVQRILDLFDEEKNVLERLPMMDKPIYKVPAGNILPKYFRSLNMDVDQVRSVYLKSSLTKQGMNWSTPKAPAQKLQPLLPDKEMHRVLRMASGKLNGKVGQGEMLHVLKGIVKKEATVNESETLDENVTTVTETFKITFKIVDRYGNIFTLSN